MLGEERTPTIGDCIKRLVEAGLLVHAWRVTQLNIFSRSDIMWFVHPSTRLYDCRPQYDCRRDWNTLRTFALLAIIHCFGLGIVHTRQLAFAQQEPNSGASPASPSITNPSNISHSTNKFALLIGISRYQHLSDQLDGCENDVRAIHDVLVDRFQFPPEHITTLVNESATGEGIRQAFVKIQQLVEQCRRAGRQPVVYFHFSGHGSQVADQPASDKNCDEVDGLDQTIVPYDAQRQGGSHDIRDDELYEFVQSICVDDQTRLWCVLDCCHSGGGVRGATKFRKLQRTVTPRPVASTDTIPTRRLPPGAVFLSACQAHELEPEYKDGDKAYGLLSRFLVQTLYEEGELSALSYDLLLQSIVNRYQRDRSIGTPPAPTLEFGAIDRLHESILGAQGIDRPAIWQCELDKATQEVRINAGLLHGLTVGSIFEVYATPQDVVVTKAQPFATSDQSPCFLELKRCSGATSVGIPFTWEGDTKLPFTQLKVLTGAVAIERYHERPSSAVRLHVQTVDAAGTSIQFLTKNDPHVPRSIRGAIESLNSKAGSEAFQWVEEADSSHFQVRVFHDFAAIFPACGQLLLEQNDKAEANPLRGGWGPIALNSETAQAEFRDYLLRISRAQNLLSIASQGDSSAEPNNSANRASLPVTVDLVRVTGVDEQSNVTESALWTTASASLSTRPIATMRDGDRFTFQINNHSTDNQPIYVTLLQINADMSIDQIHPWQPIIGSKAEGQQRVAPEQPLIVPGYFVCNGGDDPKVYGSRWAVLLATRQQNDFYQLAQGGLPVTRSADMHGSDPLFDLLQEHTEFQSRGMKRPPRPTNKYDDSWGAHVLQWNVLPDYIAD